jgi:lycopene cyclase domain-containing protein
VIGYVPIEEYSFFVLQSMLVATVWLAATRGITAHPPPTPEKQALPWRWLGLGVMGAMVVASLFGLAYGPSKAFYVSIVTAWALPILMIQWAFGAECLVAQRSSWGKPALACWVYLCIIDQWAIGQGIWFIARSQSLPRLAWQTLPLEEVWFFLVTTLMCTWTLQLVVTAEALETPFTISLLHVHNWATGKRTVSPKEYAKDRGGAVAKLHRSLNALPTEQQHSVAAICIAFLALVFGRNLGAQSQVGTE